MANNTTTIPFEDDFKSWFASSANHPQSPSDYLSGLRTVFNCVAPRLKFKINSKEYTAKDLMDALPHLIGQNKDSKKFAIRLLTYILEEIIHLPSGTCANQKNLPSHIRKYREYVICLILSSDKKYFVKKHAILGKVTAKIAQGLLGQLPELDEVYTQAELLSIFKQRFITQDRVGGNYTHKLPMRKISSKLSDLKFIDWLYDFLLKNVKFIVDKSGKTVKLEEINSLTIEKDGGVKVKVKGSTKQLDVYTEVFGESEYKRFKDLLKCDISNLALDHDCPIFIVLKEITNVPNLDTIDKTTDYQGLFDEVMMIHEKVSFTIMDQTENVKKGKKYFNPK